MNILTRICIKCGCTLNKENTGGLRFLQPYCNECTVKHEKECNHKWSDNLLLSNPLNKQSKKQCYLCGYVRDLCE